MTKREFTLVGITILIMCIPMAIIAHRNQKPELPSTAFDHAAVTTVKTKVGEKRQFCDAPTKTLDQLEIHETTLNPGEMAHPPHQHPEEEFMVVTEGTGEIVIDGKTTKVGPGSMMYSAAGKLHGIVNTGKTPLLFYFYKWKA